MQTINQHCDEKSEVRIFVNQWLHTEPITDQYITYPKDIRILINYCCRIGLTDTVRKVRSRLLEGKRNKKIAGIGYGTIVSPGSPNLPIGTDVIFLATNQDAALPTAVIPHALASRIPHNAIPPASVQADITNVRDLIKKLAGWSSYSGAPLDKSLADSILSLGFAPPSKVPAHKTETWTTYTENKKPLRQSSGDKRKKKTASLHGLGNYAKTIILPAITRSLNLVCVHEIDPAQLNFAQKWLRNTALSTDPKGGNENTDSWFIAGYHHTHAGLAASALAQGAYAVVEKPLATTQDDLALITSHLKSRARSRLFTCFQRRYSPFNKLIASDVDLRFAAALDMHAIVYEIPLPKNHWYNWPNSGTRLTSNGCHWIDYFLFLNSYVPVVQMGCWRPRGTDVAVRLKLENGAFFTMTITDSGSPRHGVRDHVELRQSNTTITITDNSRYESEGRFGLLRRQRCHPLSSHKSMYRTIVNAILHSKDADPHDRLLSTAVTLELQALQSDC